MEYRNLGLTDLSVSTLGLGCIQFGDKADLPETKRIVHRALDLGINYFDTANVYSDGVGEEYLAKALGPRRKDIILATKGGRVRMGERRKLVRDSTPDSIREAIDASLKRLETDYIDLYQIHWPDPDTPIEATMEVLHEIVQAGKARYVGVCNYAGEQVRRAYAAFPDLATAQSPYNMFRRELEYETFPFCAEHGISVIPYWPLERGILAGRYSSDDLPAGASAEMRRQVAVADSLRSLAERAGRPMAHVALAWLLAKPAVASVIPGASRLDQLEENARLSGWNLEPGEVQEIDRVLARSGRDGL